MTTLIFATNNQNKVQEIRSVLGDAFEIMSLQEAGINIDIPEPHATLEENAKEKSSTINELTGKNCFSEDTGLEVAALNGAPGVRSARYAGDDAGSAKNVEKLLENLTGVFDRKAQFKTVISLIIDNEHLLFEGICRGSIANAPSGENGFGYDPVFIPEGASKTFAEMTLEEKNNFSHRKKAAEKLIAFLAQYGQD